jgi:hypothetical protein
VTGWTGWSPPRSPPPMAPDSGSLATPAPVPACCNGPGGGGPRHAPRGSWTRPRARRSSPSGMDEVVLGRLSPYDVAAEVLGRAQTGCAHMTIWETESEPPRWPRGWRRRSASWSGSVREWSAGAGAAGAQPCGATSEFTSVSGARGRAGSTPRSTSLSAGGAAGECFPYTAAFTPTMYRGRPSGPCASFAGFGTAEDTNARLQVPARAGQTGSRSRSTSPPSWATTPTIPGARARSGKCCVAVSSLADMETLFTGSRWTRSPPR